MGDVEGVAEESSVGAQDIAAGTGDIDGDCSTSERLAYACARTPPHPYRVIIDG